VQLLEWQRRWWRKARFGRAPYNNLQRVTRTTEINASKAHSLAKCGNDVVCFHSSFLSFKPILNAAFHNPSRMRGLFEILAALSSIVTRRDSISTYPNVVDQAAVPGAQTNQTTAPFYPSPWMTGTGDWAEAYQKAREFVSQLTLLEKVNLTTGVG
jgi:hypothetical protein